MLSKKFKKDQVLIEIRAVNINFGTFEALRDVSMSIHQGDRIGLVGPNGAGKSTLLKIVSGKIVPDTGKVEKSPGASVGYLPQNTTGDNRINKQKSGGEKTKLILSKLFTEQHDVYLLDEPTNNLDLEGLEWLEREISKPSSEGSAFVIVSHDRDFLDRVVNKIIEVNELNHGVRLFECSYSEYLELHKKELEEQWKRYEETSEEKKRLKKTTEQRSDWIKKIERKRANNRNLDAGEKEKPRAAYLRDKEGAMGQRVKAVKKRLNKIAEDLSELSKPESKLPINLKFEEVERSGEIVFRLKDVLYEYKDGTKSIGPINFEAKYSERIHISGKNGSGKTTLIRMLLDQFKPASGDIQVGSRVRIGYLPQEDFLNLDEDVIQTAFRVLGIKRDDEQEGLFRRTLKRFSFEEDDVKKKIGQLSSGERSRLQLALMKLMKPNCIILDEPTNHLDIECVEAMEKALKEFEGTLIVVSHDKKFVKEVGFNKEFTL